MIVEEEDKVRENKVRRMAQRQGLAVKKSRRRDPRALNYGTYWIVDPFKNTVVAGDTNNGYGMGLDEVEAWLS